MIIHKIAWSPGSTCICVILYSRTGRRPRGRPIPFRSVALHVRLAARAGPYVPHSDDSPANLDLEPTSLEPRAVSKHHRGLVLRCKPASQSRLSCSCPRVGRLVDGTVPDELRLVLRVQLHELDETMLAKRNLQRCGLGTHNGECKTALGEGKQRGLRLNVARELSRGCCASEKSCRCRRSRRGRANRAFAASPAARWRLVSAHPQQPWRHEATAYPTARWRQPSRPRPAASSTM